MIVKRYGKEIDLSYEHKAQCPRCSSQGNDRGHDNLHVYGLDSDGEHLGGHCFACEYTIPSQKLLDKIAEENGEEQEIEIMGKPFTAELKDQIKEQTGFNPKGYRGISLDISKLFRVRYQYSEDTGEVESTLYPCTKDYKLTGYKVRKHPKDFTSPIGETGKDCDLFGQFLFKNSSGKYLVITSGEHDAMAAYEMLDSYRKGRNQGEYDPIPVVSPTIGESGAYKQLQANYEWLNRFEKIIYCKDPDAAGDKALEKISRVIPKRKLYVMELATVKDPNQALEKGKQKEFISKFFSASAYVPSGIVGSSELLGKMKEAALVPKVPLPPFMHKLQEMMAGGIPLKKIINLGSASGTGKSTIIDEMVYYWLFHSPHKIGVLSLESDSAEYGGKLLSRHLGRKIDLISDPQDKYEFLESSEVEEQANHLFRNEDGSHRFHIIEDRDGTLDSIKELISQLVIECEARIIIIDPIQDVLDGTSNEEQSTFMKWLKGMVKSHDVTFVLVNHVRKSNGNGKANSTGADIHEEDFQGSSSIFKSASCNLLFTRNKEHESDLMRNITKMKCTKMRWTGRTSPKAGEYYYDNDTHTLYDLDDYLDSHPSSRAEYDSFVEGNTNTPVKDFDAISGSNF